MKKESQIFYTFKEDGRWEQDAQDQIVHIDQVPRKRGKSSRQGQRPDHSWGSLGPGPNVSGLDMYAPHGKRDYPGGQIPRKKRTVIRIRPEVTAVASQASRPGQRAGDKDSAQAQKGRREAASRGMKNGSRQQFQEKSGRGQKGGGFSQLLFLGLFILLAAFAAGVGTGWCLWGREAGTLVNLAQIQPPGWIRQELIRKNIYSRPAVSLRQVNDIVIHYVANPGSTAEENRNYFDNLADQGEDGTSASAHFVIGLDGEIIQCIPINEIAYASNNRNGDSIAIECCHPDETGKFTDATYESLVKLTAWLCDETGAGRKNVIRHYDITEKICPKYFVEHKDAWKEFLKDVRAYQGDWEE